MVHYSQEKNAREPSLKLREQILLQPLEMFLISIPTFFEMHHKIKKELSINYTTSVKVKGEN